jgi:hypothetical protein
LTIIKDVSAYANFPYENLSHAAVEGLADACISTTERKGVVSLTKSLECFLQITDQTLSWVEITSGRCDEILTLFKGALCSEQFRKLTPARRPMLIRHLDKLICRIRNMDICKPSPNARNILENYRPAQSKFEQLSLNEEKVWLWNAWGCESASGIQANLPLLPFYIKFGRAFTEQLYNICTSYLSNRRTGHIIAITKISEFVESNECDFTAVDLLTNQGSTSFFNKFFIFYYKTAVTRNASHASAVNTWRGPINFFIKNWLLTSSLFADPYDFPEPEPEHPTGSESHMVDEDGTEYKNKLVIKIPMHISDDHAFNTIKRRTFRSAEIIEAWCDKKIADTREHIKNFDRLRLTGVPVKVGVYPSTPGGNKWLLSPENPHSLNNLAATLHTHGYAELLQSINNYHARSTGVGEKLGLPSTDGLLPFCLKLIKNDPRITPSFLASVELYDKHGNARGVEKGDTTTYLHGYKDRKGAERAEMRLKLNEEGNGLVQTIVAMTSPLRDYLKNKGDDAWRQLLLTAKHGTGIPQRYRCKTNNIGPKVNEALTELNDLFPDDADLNKELAATMMKPTAMRATAAVIIFLKTGSVHAMAEALGHTRYEPDLLERYLPKSILYFFRDRWVRRFQTGIIIQSMQNTKHLLKSSGFTSMDELVEFMENFSLHLSENVKQNPKSHSCSPKQCKAVISISVEIARILITLTEAKEQNHKKLHGQAAHWAEFGTLLFSYLEEDPENQLEALDLLKQARSLGPLHTLDELIYEAS